MGRITRHLSSDEACALANLNNAEVLRGLEFLTGLDLTELRRWGPAHIRKCNTCWCRVVDLENLERYAIPPDISEKEKKQIFNNFIVSIRAQNDVKEESTDANK